MDASNKTPFEEYLLNENKALKEKYKALKIAKSEEKPIETKVEEKPIETKVEEKPIETKVEEKPIETKVETTEMEIANKLTTEINFGGLKI